jgi:putative phosphoesterase
MRIGVVSDTHGHVDRARAAVRMLESLEVEQVLHCGDIGTVEVVNQFAGWPTRFVFGNCDVNVDRLARQITEAGQTCDGWFGDFELEGVRIALLHSHRADEFRQAIASTNYRLVCYGHTHVAARDEPQPGKLVLNPGALYRANPPSLAVVELPSCEATIVPL